MAIRFQLRGKELLLEEKSILMKKVWHQLDLSPQAYLAVREGQLLTEGDTLHDGDVIQLISVISGGSR